MSVSLPLPLAPFQSEPTCPKCQGPTSSPKFHGAGMLCRFEPQGGRRDGGPSAQPVDYPDHLHCVCTGCGFEWPMAPADGRKSGAAAADEIAASYRELARVAGITRNALNSDSAWLRSTSRQYLKAAGLPVGKEAVRIVARQAARLSKRSVIGDTRLSEIKALRKRREMLAFLVVAAAAAAEAN